MALGGGHGWSGGWEARLIIVFQGLYTPPGGSKPCFPVEFLASPSAPGPWSLRNVDRVCSFALAPARASCPLVGGGGKRAPSDPRPLLASAPVPPLSPAAVGAHRGAKRPQISCLRKFLLRQDRVPASRGAPSLPKDAPCCFVSMQCFSNRPDIGPLAPWGRLRGCANDHEDFIVFRGHTRLLSVL